VPALAGPLAALIASMPAEQADAIRGHAADALGAFATDGGLDIPGVSLVASGRSR